ncbi:hypothetical protein IFR23_07880 [Sphingomonas sp. CFBP 13603]|uniref:hypothetical protein n=1 Tax=Sphingomonas sp. CFBP 13603 TaxID=2774040 RepID=UPI0018672E27|nr:hypothetical protein [Sphingomonas sp. CFBP 13603]MBE2991933.1 hypothetical protein [Sphingomonas sp. CFBP 13603]
MNAIHTEMRYFQRRLDDTLAMADAAAGPCARKAHQLLARLYGEALDALLAQASTISVQRRPAFSAGIMRADRNATARGHRSSTHRTQRTLTLAS